ncbi:MAG TPA: thioredoxin family protein [Verrucomicrobiae bacterium]
MKTLIATLLTSWLAFTVTAAELTWLTDLPAAQAQAKKEKKLVLMDFTGSDWCGWCIRLNKEVFNTPEFNAYAKANLVLVELDFPRNKPQTDALKKANEALQQKYGAEGFPTIVVLNSDGKMVWKQGGYMPGGPKAWIAQLDGAKKK